MGRMGNVQEFPNKQMSQNVICFIQNYKSALVYSVEYNDISSKRRHDCKYIYISPLPSECVIIIILLQYTVYM